MPPDPPARTAAAPRKRWRRFGRWLPLSVLAGFGGLLGAGLLAGGVAAITAWYLLQGVLPALGALGLIGGIGYGVVKRRWSPLLGTTIAAATLALVPLLWAFDVWPVAFPASRTWTGPAATVRLPLDGPLRVAWGGDRIETNYHAAAPDQRWAYDLVVAPYFTNSPRLGDYGCYGRPVLAPASGEVAVAHDGAPDAVPGVLSSNPEAPFGNYVALRLDRTGTYLVIAHLQPGSLVVQPGQRVTEGALLGRCGNSGNTSEPHVHLHHQRESPQEAPVGFAEGLPLYFRDHTGAPMPRGGIAVQGGKPVPTGDVVQHRPGAERAAPPLQP